MKNILFINACPRPQSRTLALAQEVLKKIQAEGDVTTDSSSTDTAAPAADASADSAASTADGSAPAENADNTAATDANAAQ